ncbi:MAG: aldehyde dehydrogenase family protein [Bacteroidota bacterium]
MSDFDLLLQKQRLRATFLKTEDFKPRRRRLEALEKWILSHRRDLYQALEKDLLKSEQETNLSEIYTVLTEIREAKNNLRRWTEKEYVGTTLTYFGSQGYHFYEPKGVCLIISPWNYPFNLAIGPVVSAIAAGNTFILKPSEFTPHTSALMARMINDLFEEDLGVVIEGDVKVSQELLRLPFDHIFFTGSPNVGKVVMEAAAKNLTSITLELGGKSPTIIDETASLKDAAEKIAWGKWLNAGQTCVAPDYLFIHEQVYDAFMDLFREQMKTAYPEESYTGIISEKHFSRLSDMIDQAVKLGAVKHMNENITNKQKMPPVILEKPTEEMQVLQEEIFGPILPVLKYSDLEQVIKYVNSKPKPLSLYFFSRSRSNQERILKSTSSGNLVINDCVLQFAHPGLAFGGESQSGFGKSHGKDGFLAFSNKKAVLEQRIGLTTAKLLYPPYTRFRKFVIEFLLRYF